MPVVLGSILLFGFTKLAPAEVVGTDLCFGLIVASIGSAIHLSAGNYDGALLLKLVVGGVLGAITRSLLAGRIAPKLMRVTVLVMLVVLGVQLAFHRQPAPPHLQAEVQVPYLSVELSEVRRFYAAGTGARPHWL